ncbi:hypothetical protein E3P99_01891 [Wallemia hederae]|uniref:Uncharacterized protein n=1 Tax=Wallemia hederae TaxID=1540922 RepID=A0A4T0FNM8_9BASI|nr:hypothetical protein E3P99_01891 [Wallemia hederae]
MKRFSGYFQKDLTRRDHESLNQRYHLGFSSHYRSLQPHEKTAFQSAEIFIGFLEFSEISSHDRDAFLKQILADIRPSSVAHSWDIQAVLAALKVVKVLGRSPIGTSSLTTSDAFNCLASVMERKAYCEASTATPSLSSRLQSHRPANLSSVDAISHSEIQLEALTIVANTMLLHDEARYKAVESRLPELAYLALKAHANSSDIHFVAARCLFLCTLNPHPVVYKLVHEDNLVDVIHARLLQYTPYIIPTNKSNSIPPRSKELITDILKLFFNITLHHKSAPADSVLGENWDDKFNKLLQPILSLLMDLTNNGTNTNAISPMPQPIPQLIHTLLCFPIKPFTQIWSNPNNNSIFSPSAAINRLSRTLSRASVAQSDSTTKLNLDNMDDYPLLNRLIELLNSVINTFWPSTSIEDGQSMDSAQAKTKAASVGVNLDELLSPLIMLLRKLVADDLRGNGGFKGSLRKMLNMNDIDRSVKVEQRGDLLGVLVRFLTSSLFSSIKTTVGELLFALCDSDPKVLSSTIGFGNAAGFLFSKGLLGAGAADPNEDGVNPVTGTFDDSVAGGPEEMTEEEKEAEAEKIFEAFDRLNRNGIIKTSNPMQDPKNQPRFQEIEEEEVDQLNKQDEEDEKDVDEIMSKYKSRSDKAAQ